MLRLVIACLITVLGMTACQTGLQTRSLLFQVLSGGEFILHRDIAISPGRVRVAFQDGVLAHGVSEFSPRCELEVMKILDEPQTVPAGTYRIDKVRGMTHQVLYPNGDIKLAASGIIGLDTGSTQWIMESYRMTLRSDLLEDVLLLHCGGAYDYPFRARYPTLKEMQASLGDYATIKLR